MAKANSAANPDPTPDPAPRRRPGNPNIVAGGPSLNPSGKAKAPAEGEPPDDGVVTAEKMRRVLGQSRKLDKGPTEKALRKWLDKDPKGFTEAIDKRAKVADDPGVAAELAAVRERAERAEKENADLRRQLSAGDDEDDPGTDAALAQIEKLLKGGGDGHGG